MADHLVQYITKWSSQLSKYLTRVINFTRCSSITECETEWCTLIWIIEEENGNNWEEDPCIQNRRAEEWNIWDWAAANNLRKHHWSQKRSRKV